MSLERSHQALADARWARDQMAAARDREADYRRWFRVAIAFLMAVGPTINDEARFPKDSWDWERLVAPHGRHLMKLRDPILKQTKTTVSATESFEPDSAIRAQLSSARRYRRRPGSTGPSTIVTQSIIPDEQGNLRPSRVISGNVVRHWTWDSGPYRGQDPIAVIDHYLGLLEGQVLPEAKRLLASARRPRR